MSAPAQRAVGWVTSQGHYAGSVSRFLAFVIDAAVSSGLFALGLAATSFAVQVVTGNSVSWNRSNIVVAIIFAGWEFFYFGYSWAASGKTFGMAVLGVRVVRADGAIADPWRGAVRALAFPLSFLFFGLGFLGILVQRERRALHDLIAGTAVVYAWDARAARLRFLAREAGPGPAGAAAAARRRRPRRRCPATTPAEARLVMPGAARIQQRRHPARGRGRGDHPLRVRHRRPRGAILGEAGRVLRRSAFRNREREDSDHGHASQG